VRPRLAVSLFTLQGEGADVKVGLDQRAVRTYRKRFGKNLIFTHRHDLPVTKMVQAYRDRSEVGLVVG
jgi:hypothetical protein